MEKAPIRDLTDEEKQRLKKKKPRHFYENTVEAFIESGKHEGTVDIPKDQNGSTWLSGFNRAIANKFSDKVRAHGCKDSEADTDAVMLERIDIKKKEA